jgi:hypothetical protein
MHSMWFCVTYWTFMITYCGYKSTIPLASASQLVHHHVGLSMLQDFVSNLFLYLFEPVQCMNNKCITTTVAMMNGIRKWNVKNQFSVALSTVNPPQIHCTKSVPPICRHCSTYNLIHSVFNQIISKQLEFKRCGSFKGSAILRTIVLWVLTLCSLLANLSSILPTYKHIQSNNQT